MSNNTLKEAHRLYKLGYAVIWLKARSKMPVEAGWTTGPRTPWEKLFESYIEGYNVGVRLGTPSKLGDKGYLAVIDVDIKGADPRYVGEAEAAVKTLIGDTICPEVASGRGGGSRHYYCVTTAPFKNRNPAGSDEYVRVMMPSKKISKRDREKLNEMELDWGYRISRAWEISLYSDGRQVVLPPSIHPDSGKEYTWTNPIAGEHPLIEFPTEPAKDGGTGTKAPGTRSGPQETVEDFEAVDVELSWLPGLSDKTRSAIVSGEGVSDRSAHLLVATNALVSAGLNKNEILSVLTERKYFLGECAFDHAQTASRKRAAQWLWNYTVKKVMDERDPVKAFEGRAIVNIGLDEKAAAEQTKEIEAEHVWSQDLVKTKEGHVVASLKNVDLILSNQVDENVFVRDLFANRDSYGVDTPWGGQEGDSLGDIDVIRVRRWLSDTEFAMDPKKDLTLDTISLISDRNGVHPVRDWLDSLEWDGKPRINTWIKKYLGGKAPEPYLSQISRLFLLAMCKRIFQPGCQWDYILVLEGPQGCYKSSTARALTTDKWFMDNLPDLRDKDAMLNLQGKWIIELGELASTKRTDYDSVKAYLSRRTDTVRSPYGRLQNDIPRQSVFIGTVNEGQYLKDPTGNRRFWPVKVGICNVEAIKANRDQLFAEAMAVYRENEDVALMLDQEANAQAQAAQDDRRVSDDETDMREALITFMTENQRKPKKERFDFSGFRSVKLFEGPGAPWGPWKGKNWASQTAAQVLANLGFEKRKSDGQRLWGKSIESFL